MAQARYLAVRRMAFEHNVNGCHECWPLAIVEKGTTASICARCHVFQTCAVDLGVFDGRLCRRRPGDRVELKWCSFYCPMTAECRPVYVQARSHSYARGGTRFETHQIEHSLPSAIAPEWPRASRVASTRNSNSKWGGSSSYFLDRDLFSSIAGSRQHVS